MDQDDPADWSIDRVVQETCHNQSPTWAVGANLKPIKDTEALAQAIKDNDIDGDNLLALEDKDIKSDLGILSFGQRRGINNMIAHLRSLSSKYQAQQRRMNVTAWVTPQLSHASAASHGRSPSLAGSLVQPSIEPTKIDGFTPTHRVDDRIRQQSGINPPKRKWQDVDQYAHWSGNTASDKTSVRQHNSELGHLASVRSTQSHLDSNNLLRSKSTTSEILSGNVSSPPLDQNQSLLNTLDFAIDEELDTSTSLTNGHAVACSNDGDHVDRRADVGSLNSQVQRKRPLKRATLIHVSDRVNSQDHSGNSTFGRSDIWRPEFANRSANNASDLQNTGPLAKRMKVTDLFASSQQPSRPPTFPGAGLRPAAGARRRPVRKDQLAHVKFDQQVVAPNGYETDATRTFLFFGSPTPIGRMQHAARCVPSSIALLHYNFEQAETSTTTLGARLIQAQSRQSQDSEWAQTNPEFDLSPRLLKLLAQYPEGDEGILHPHYGDSDEEDRWTSPGETPPPESENKDKLSRQEVDTIIDATFEQFRLDWHTRFLPRAQAKAHKNWMKAAKNPYMHNGMLMECKKLQAKASSRVQQSRSGIHLNEWRKAEDVKQQCLAVEGSVHDLEEQTLYMDVLKSKQEPSLPSQTSLRQSRQPRPHTVMANGDEDLDSDSADSFIVDNDYDPQLADSEAALIDRDSTTWSPEFTENLPAPVQEQNGGAVSQHHDNDMILDSIEDPSIDVAQEQPRQNEALAVNVREDTMDVDETEVVCPPQKLPKSAKKQGALEAAKRNPIAIPEYSESGGSDSDFERPPRLPATKYRKQGKSEAKTIDLTRSSSPPTSDRNSSLDIRTPELDGKNTFAPSLFSRRSQRGSTSSSLAFRHSPAVQKDRSQSVILDVTRVQDMEWEDIGPKDEDTAPDSRLALARHVYDMSMKCTGELLDYTKSFRDDEDLAEVLQNGLLATKEDDQYIEDVVKKNQENAWQLTFALICYATGAYVDVADDITENEIDKAHKLLQTCVTEFRQLLESLLQNYLNYVRSPPKSDYLSTPDVLSDMDIENEGPGSRKPNRKAKTKTNYAREVATQQRIQKTNYQALEKKRLALLKSQADEGVSQDKISVCINVTQPAVYLDPKIAVKVKPHQVEGIRFMWREIVENPKGKGCLLAHTMGLGKTMQVISLLAAIAQCNASEDPAMREHIPLHLRKLRVLILCPMALIENWYEEFLGWLPDILMLGRLTKLDNRTRVPHIAIQDWVDKGGVIMMSYERFRIYTNPIISTKRSKEHKPEIVRLNLIEGPSIVIGDEAHKLKNAKSQVNQCSHQINTMSRIALTGSPLNNYLEEYHTMIDWISPGYLGNVSLFRSKYIDPIKQGLYSESTTWERKTSLKRLHVLKRNLDSLIDRADFTAISKDLPPKTEFFLTITLTDEQKQAYQLYVQELRAAALGDGRKKLGITTVWSWLNILSLLLNHPSCFVEKLQESERFKELPTAHTNKEDKEDDGYDSAVECLAAENVDLAKQPVLTSAMQKVVDVFTEAKVLYRIEEPWLSNKSLLIKHILEEAVKLGEKTLIFSKSLPTLDYFEAMVKGMRLGYKRIDGRRRYPKGSSRQTEVEAFNNSAFFKVFLISTKAGGLGLNIQGASRVIINDFDFNPTWEEQAVGRAYRIGQTKPVFVYRFLMGGTFEELIFNKAVFKTQLFTRVVDEKNVIAQAAKRPGEFLFDPKDVPQKDFSECLGKDSNVLDQVLQKVDCVRNIFLTETFFQDDNETLNEQELKEANDELELERLEREDPEEYKRRLHEIDHAARVRGAQDLAANLAAMYRANMSASQSSTITPKAQPLTHFLNLAVPLPSDPNYVATNFSVSDLPRTYGGQRLPISGAFDDGFVPSRSFAGPSVGQRPLFLDDQSLRNIHPPAPFVSPNTTGVQEPLRQSPYFSFASNTLTDNHLSANSLVTSGVTGNGVATHDLPSNGHLNNGAAIGNFNDTVVGKPDPKCSSNPSVHEDTFENKESDNSKNPSGCRPQ